MKRFQRKVQDDIEAVLGDQASPSDKRAAVTIIDLRTKVEIRTVALHFSMALNMAFIVAKLIK